MTSPNAHGNAMRIPYGPTLKIAETLAREPYIFSSKSRPEMTNINIYIYNL
jgi:hypothetical protein